MFAGCFTYAPCLQVVSLTHLVCRLFHIRILFAGCFTYASCLQVVSHTHLVCRLFHIHTPFLQVITCYETYDPDPVELDQQIQNRNEGKVLVKLKSDLPTSGELKKSLSISEMNERVKLQHGLDRDRPSVDDGKPPKLPAKKFNIPLYTKPIKSKMAEKQTDSIRPPVLKKPSNTQELQMDIPKHLDDLDQYECVSGGEPDQNLANACQTANMKNTQNVQESLADLSLYESFGQEDSSAREIPGSEGLNALDQYENLHLIPTPRGNSIPASSDDTKSESPEVQNFVEPDDYENLKSLQIPIKGKISSVSMSHCDSDTEYPLCTTVKI